MVMFHFYEKRHIFSSKKTSKNSRLVCIIALILQFLVYLELIYQVTIDTWFQIYSELEDEGIGDRYPFLDAIVMAQTKNCLNPVWPQGSHEFEG